MKLQDLLNEKPTKQWRERMLEYGDDLFTPERLALCDKVIDKYINELILIQGDLDQEKIMKFVEELVISFNDLNEENEYFIETMEREELAEFIDKAAKLAGLEVKAGQDITEEWREW
ncbi:hypothetical protein ACFQ88_11315 [Paenibacillus sp. NPDC056579]|uniref:hypothetical protein n=1 Tax=unclassified Paenibacillus TaxID=185978 RepID=UPI001EF89C7A|nr:hypothetical protein [Paenibacillus sp. H1-7]ULL14860.1 hypothetical protein DVH26_10630 [Paenibacillus sp. H1-7]